MNKSDESVPEPERQKLKFPVGEELLAGEPSPEADDGPRRHVPRERPREHFATSNPGPRSPRELPTKEPRIYTNPGPPKLEETPGENPYSLEPSAPSPAAGPADESGLADDVELEPLPPS